jgi:hypothetical protein
LKYSQQIVLQHGPKELIVGTLEKLGKSDIEGQAQQAITKRKTPFFKSTSSSRQTTRVAGLGPLGSTKSMLKLSTRRRVMCFILSIVADRRC